MLTAVENLEFEEAARTRDKIKRLEAVAPAVSDAILRSGATGLPLTIRKP